MTECLVSWDIEIEADSPQEAAKLAREIQLDPDNIATHFHVSKQGDENVMCVELSPREKPTCH